MERQVTRDLLVPHRCARWSRRVDVVMGDYHVVRRADGQWEARAAGSNAGSIHATQREAQRAANDQARSSGGGEVRIHGRDGRIRESPTIGKRDPRRTTG
jgi:hypothetical protein